MSVLSDASEFDISGASDALKKTLVVIPALNEEPHIEKCIRSLITDALIDNRTKVIVADGGSTDGTPKIVETLQKEFPNLTLVRNAEKLQSAGINLAVREEGQEDTRFVVRCDAHSIYPPRFVERVVSRLDDTGAASLVVAMDALGEGCFGKANAWVVDTPLGSGGSAHRGGRKSGFVDHGHHAGFKFETFQALGGYDASFSHNEDAEYDQRVRAAGEKIYLDSDIRIRYIPRSSARHLAKQYFNYGKGRARTVQKHKQRLRVRQAIPVLALLACVASLAMATWRLEALIIPGVYLVVLLLTSIWIAISQRSICGLFAGLASGIMHMSWAAGFLKQILLGFDQHPSQLADLSIRSNPAKPVDNLSGVGTNVKQRTGSVFLSPWRGFNRVLYMVHRDLSRFVRSIGPKSPPSASEQSNRDNNPSLLDRGVTRLQNLLASPQLSEIGLDGDVEPFDGRILHNSRGV
ncbi:MAG: glycosyltransferase family 2 protein, partial [Pseudomonadota bacterium]